MRLRACEFFAVWFFFYVFEVWNFTRTACYKIMYSVRTRIVYLVLLVCTWYAVRHVFMIYYQYVKCLHIVLIL